MEEVDIEKVRAAIRCLDKSGAPSSSSAVWNLLDEYLRLQAVSLHVDSHSLAFESPNDSHFNFLSTPAGAEDRDIFIRWDINLRKDRAYGIERGSAVEWHWAQFLVNNGPVTIAMVDHASESDPDGWKKAAYELEEEAK